MLALFSSCKSYQNRFDILEIRHERGAQHFNPVL